MVHPKTDSYGINFLTPQQLEALRRKEAAWLEETVWLSDLPLTIHFFRTIHEWMPF